MAERVEEEAKSGSEVEVLSVERVYIYLLLKEERVVVRGNKLTPESVAHHSIRLLNPVSLSSLRSPR